MNQSFPLPTRRFKAVFVVDLTHELRALDNLIIDIGIKDDDTHANLLVYAIRKVMDRWGFAYCKQPHPIMNITPEQLNRVNYFVAAADNFGLHNLARILIWAPSIEIDEVWIEEGQLYFCYEDN